VRLKQGVFVLPSAMALGATRSRPLAFLAGRALASDLRALGISMNLAPVLDVNSNPANPVIGTRSIGERPELVADLGTWFVRGQEEGGVVTVAKHFPGHGDTQTDSHFDLPQLPHDIERLKRLEFVPFRAAFSAGLDAVMTAHIALPAVAEGPNIPATLSRRLLTNVLREDLGFNGLILTDGLEMRGIVEGEGIGEAAVKAILAGADMVMVLWSKRDREEVFTKLKAAYASGVISHDRLRASLRRILQTKERRGVMGPQVVSTTDVQRMLHDQLADEIAERAVTLVRSHGDLIPTTGKRTLVLEPEGPIGTLLGATDDVQMPLVPTRERRQHDVTAAIAKSVNADVIIAVAQNRYHVEVIRAVREAVPTVPMIFVSMSSPYYLSLVPSADAYICTYSGLPSAQRALVKVLRGERGTVGRLPVTIPGLYPYGAGVVEGSEADASLGASKKLARSPK
jgi:beta-N-acetylhexosaminidase